MKTFCAHCGHSMEYASAKPNFCVKCGTKMDGGTASTPSTFVPRSRPIPQNNYVELDYEPEGVDLDSVSIVAEAKQGVKLVEIIGKGRLGWINRKGMSKAEIEKYNERMTAFTKKDIDDKGNA